MAKEKLIPKLADDDKRDPQQRFADLGAKVFSTSKAQIDERERQWARTRKKPRHT
jgi:hypothetical protein